MSLLAAFASEAAPLLLVDWGEAVSYLPLDGVAVSRTMAFAELTADVEDASDHKRLVRRGQWTAYQDADTGVALPAVGDKITAADGTAWGVTGWADGNGAVWLIDVTNVATVMTGAASKTSV